MNTTIHVYACTCVRMHAGTHLEIGAAHHLCRYFHRAACMYVCMYMHVCMYVLSVCVYACVWMIWKYVCMYAHACMHVCIYVCTYVRMHLVHVWGVTESRILVASIVCTTQCTVTMSPFLGAIPAFLALPFSLKTSSVTPWARASGQAVTKCVHIHTCIHTCIRTFCSTQYIHVCIYLSPTIQDAARHAKSPAWI